MIYRYYSNTDKVACIDEVKRVEINNPLLSDLIKLIKIWQNDSEATRMLSYEYSYRSNVGRLNIESIRLANNYCANIFVRIGNGLVHERINQAEILLSTNCITNENYATVSLVMPNIAGTLDCLRILNNLNLRSNITVVNDTLVRVSLPSVNVNEILNIFASIHTSLSEGRLQRVTKSWV